jgi:hypothetical protein
MTDAEKRQFASKLNEQVTAKNTEQPHIQENDSVVDALSHISVLVNKINDDVASMAAEAQKLQLQLDNRISPLDTRSCKGICSCITGINKTYNIQVLEATEQYLAQSKIVFERYRLKMAYLLTDFDSSILILKYGDACVVQANKQKVLSWQQEVFNVIDIFRSYSADMYEKGANAACKVKHTVVCH